MKKSELIALAVIGAIYLIIILSSPNGFWIIDEGNKYLWAENLSAKGSFTLEDRAYEISPEASAFKGPFTQRVDESSKLMTVFSPVFSLLIAPFVGLGGLQLALIIPAICSVLLIISVNRLARKLMLEFGFLSMIILGLASPLLFYSVTLWEHGLAILLGLVGLNLALREGKTTWRQLLAGLLLAASVFIRVEMAVFALGAWLFLLKRDLKLIPGVVAGIILLGSLHLIMTGSILPLSIGSNYGLRMAGVGLGEFLSGRLEALYALFLECGGNLYLSLGLLAAAIGFLILPGVFKFILPLGLLAAVIASFFDSAPFFHLAQRNSLLYTAPFYFAALFYRADNTNLGKLKRLIWFIIVIGAFALPVYRGMHYGPRLLLSIIPLLAIIGEANLKEARRKAQIFRMDALYALIAVQFLTAIGSIVLLEGKREANVQRCESIMAQSRPTIITPQWWLQQEIPGLYKTRDFYLLETTLDLKIMLIDYYRGGVRFFTLLVRENEPDELYEIFNACPPKQIGAFKVSTKYPSLNLVGLNYAIGFDAEGAAKLADELGVYFGQTGDLKKSEKYLRFAAKWDQSVGKYRYNLGYCLGQMKRYDEALEEIESAAELDPNNKNITNFREELKKALKDTLNE